MEIPSARDPGFLNHGVNNQATIEKNTRFAEEYITLRRMEGRIYPDEMVARLPVVPSSDPLQKEWKIRARSSKKLLDYLNTRQAGLKILDIGCGNGWLSYQLSQVNQATVVALDINPYELEQARRVFSENQRLQFVYGDPEDLNASLQFDIIVFAASIQYFSSFNSIIDSCLKRLSTGGEIHILDSHFYRPAHLDQARQRSTEYFIFRGADKMKEHYFHHPVTVLEAYHHNLLYDPSSFLNKFFHRNPFQWISIQGLK